MECEGRGNLGCGSDVAARVGPVAGGRSWARSMQKNCRLLHLRLLGWSDGTTQCGAVLPGVLVHSTARPGATRPTQHALLSCLYELSHYTPFKPTPCSLKAMRTGNAPTGPPHSPNQERDETRGSRIATGLGSPPRRHRNRAHRRLAHGRGHCKRTAP